MNTIFMDSKNSKTSDPHRLLINLRDKIDLRRKKKSISLSNFSIYYTWTNKKMLYKNSKFKISAPIWNDEFEVPDGFYIRYSMLFWIYIKKAGEKTINLLIRIYINKRETKITFKIKTGYYLKLLTPETMELIGSTKSKITKDENCENVLNLEITEVVLIHRNVVNNSYQQNSRALSAFVLNKSFGQLLDISSNNFIFLKAFDSEFSYIEVWFTHHNSRSLEIEDKINITLVVN